MASRPKLTPSLSGNVSRSSDSFLTLPKLTLSSNSSGSRSWDGGIPTFTPVTMPQLTPSLSGHAYTSLDSEIPTSTPVMTPVVTPVMTPVITPVIAPSPVCLVMPKEQQQCILLSLGMCTWTPPSPTELGLQSLCKYV